MAGLTLELILWMLFAFFLGCVLGCLFRKVAAASADFGAPAVGMFAGDDEDGRDIALERSGTMAPPVPGQTLAAMPGEPAPVAAMRQPQGLTAARGGKADDLQRISGVGVKLEAVLHELGFYHFDQIAAWTAEEVAWVDEHLKFRGRIAREEWIEQARLLAEGNEAEFSRLFGTGGLVDPETGETRSGSHTRRS